MGRIRKLLKQCGVHTSFVLTQKIQQAFPISEGHQGSAFLEQDYKVSCICVKVLSQMHKCAIAEHALSNEDHCFVGETQILVSTLLCFADGGSSSLLLHLTDWHFVCSCLLYTSSAKVMVLLIR